MNAAHSSGDVSRWFFRTCTGGEPAGRGSGRGLRSSVSSGPRKGRAMNSSIRWEEGTAAIQLGTGTPSSSASLVVPVVTPPLHYWRKGPARHPAPESRGRRDRLNRRDRPERLRRCRLEGHELRWAILRRKRDDARCAVANRLDIAPGIVVGRLQREEILKWSQGNRLKRRFRFAEED